MHSQSQNNNDTNFTNVNQYTNYNNNLSQNISIATNNNNNNQQNPSENLPIRMINSIKNFIFPNSQESAEVIKNMKIDEHFCQIDQICYNLKTEF